VRRLKSGQDAGRQAGIASMFMISPDAWSAFGLSAPLPHGFFFAAQGLQGLQAFLAAQGLQGLHALAAQGLQGLHALAAQGLQGLQAFFAAQGLHGLHALAAHGLQDPPP
jgi:hypothetical protein